jgi:hypothetical protein
MPIANARLFQRNPPGAVIHWVPETRHSSVQSEPGYVRFLVPCLWPLPTHCGRLRINLGRLMIIALMFFALSQSPPPAPARPEPAVCDLSERDPATGSRLWCPAELLGRVPRNLMATMPIEGTGKGWALLKCDLGEGGVTTACGLVDESQPGSSFGAWATRVQLRATAQVRGGSFPQAGDSYYAFARWEVR